MRFARFGSQTFWDEGSSLLGSSQRICYYCGDKARRMPSIARCFCFDPLWSSSQDSEVMGVKPYMDSSAGAC
jgi:hypothetical protein